MKSNCKHCGSKVAKGGTCRSCGPMEKNVGGGGIIPPKIPIDRIKPKTGFSDLKPSPRPMLLSGSARGSGRAMLGKVAKAASDVGAKAPSISGYERGSYKAGKTQADGFGRKAIGHVAPKKTDTYDTVPDKGFKDISVASLEVGGYKRK